METECTCGASQGVAASRSRIGFVCRERTAWAGGARHDRNVDRRDARSRRPDMVDAAGRNSSGRIAGAFRLSLARAQSEVAIAVSLLSILANPSWKPRTAGASSSCLKGESQMTSSATNGERSLHRGRRLRFQPCLIFFPPFAKSEQQRPDTLPQVRQ